MNIFKHEMRTHRIGLIWWCVGMAALVASGMAKYAAYQSAGQSINELLAAVPKTLQIIFGMTGFDLQKASGFYGVLFLYVAVMAAIHASLLGSHVICEEERDRTSEFLYTKPISRSRALTAKLLAGLTNVVIFNMVTLLSSVYFVGYFGDGQSFIGDVLVLMAGLFLLQLVFFAIGTVVAGVVKKAKAAPTLATSVMFLTFLLFYLVNFDPKLDVLKYFSPFKYYDAHLLMSQGLDPMYVGLSLAIVVLAVAGTYRFYARRDLAA